MSCTPKAKKLITMMLNPYSHNDSPYESAGYDTALTVAAERVVGITPAPVAHAANPVQAQMAALRARYVHGSRWPR